MPSGRSLEFVAPGHRLWVAMADSLGSPTGLLWFVHIVSADILQTNLCQVRTIREGRCLLDPLVHRNATICLVKTLPMRELILPEQTNNQPFCRFPYGHIDLIPTLLRRVHPLLPPTVYYDASWAQHFLYSRSACTKSLVSVGPRVCWVSSSWRRTLLPGS